MNCFGRGTPPVRRFRGTSQPSKRRWPRFPLTPALSTPIALTPSPSPIRWARVAGERGNPRLRNRESEAHGLAASWKMFLPLLGGEGRGEGETSVRITACAPFVASAGGSPEGPFGLELFIASSFRLCQRLLKRDGRAGALTQFFGMQVFGRCSSRWCFLRGPDGHEMVPLV